jgi:NAD-dependent deacetylase
MIVPLSEQAIQSAAQYLRNARHAVAFTGAGISTPSGIPDFRSQGTGLWEKSDPMKVASLSSFRHTPQVFFEWLRPLAQQIDQSQPNPAHLALARLEQAGILKAVITQNIDGLHQRAGSQTVLEVHGSLTTLSCGVCRKTYPLEDFRLAFLQDGVIPHCPKCHHILKPDIVLFEEMLPAETWQTAQDHCEQADVILIAGSSLEVMPAASLPLVAAEHGAAILINNFTPTFLDEQAAVLLTADVAETLPRIQQSLL